MLVKVDVVGTNDLEAFIRCCAFRIPSPQWPWFSFLGAKCGDDLSFMLSAAGNIVTRVNHTRLGSCHK
jgi:hypothetical protein